MSRYFIELSYKGTNYAGFQVQQNANSIQAELEKALRVFFKEEFSLTGSSRTDAGVHALQNFFHVDAPGLDNHATLQLDRSVYNLNAILPGDIVLKRIYKVADDQHCRFDALSREYKYFIYQSKDPFKADRAFFYPYKLDKSLLDQAAEAITRYKDFTSFSKRNTQVHSFNCSIYQSQWMYEDGCLYYNVKANRFLRGMVRGLVGTMLRVGTGRLSFNEFIHIIESKDCSLADFSVPPHGLFLAEVTY